MHLDLNISWLWVFHYMCVELLLGIFPWEGDTDRKFQPYELCILVLMHLPTHLPFHFKCWKTDYLSATQKELKVWLMFHWNKQHANFYHTLWNSEIGVSLPCSISFSPTHVLFNILPEPSELQIATNWWKWYCYIATLLRNNHHSVT